LAYLNTNYYSSEVKKLFLLTAHREK
jgi:hypothetical protein